MRRRAAGLAIAGALAGCAAVPPGDPQRDASLRTFAVAPDGAGIFVFRGRGSGELARLDVLLNGVPLGWTTGGTYLYRDVAPGRHTVTSLGEDTVVLEVDVPAGSLAFVRQQSAWGFFSARSRLHQVEEAQGREGVQAARLARSEAPTQTVEVRVDADDPAWSGPLDCRAANVFGGWRFVAPGTVEVAVAGAPLSIDCALPADAAQSAGALPRAGAATAQATASPRPEVHSGARTGAGVGAAFGVAVGVAAVPIMGQGFAVLLAAGSALKGATIGGMVGTSTSGGGPAYPSPVVVHIGRDVPRR